MYTEVDVHTYLQNYRGMICHRERSFSETVKRRFYRLQLSCCIRFLGFIDTHTDPDTDKAKGIPVRYCTSTRIIIHSSVSRAYSLGKRTRRESFVTDAPPSTGTADHISCQQLSQYYKSCGARAAGDRGTKSDNSNTSVDGSTALTGRRRCRICS